MKHLFAILFLLMIYFNSFSQEYKEAVGLKGSITPGLAYKKFVDNEIAHEFILSFKRKGVKFTVLGEMYKPVVFDYTENLSFFYGYGAHLGFFKEYYRSYIFSDYRVKNKDSYIVAGLDAVVGVEYFFPVQSITVGLEYKPFFDLFGPNYFNIHLWNFALNIQYTF